MVAAWLALTALALQAIGGDNPIFGGPNGDIAAGIAEHCPHPRIAKGRLFVGQDDWQLVYMIAVRL